MHTCESVHTPACICARGAQKWAPPLRQFNPAAPRLQLQLCSRTTRRVFSAARLVSKYYRIRFSFLATPVPSSATAMEGSVETTATIGYLIKPDPDALANTAFKHTQIGERVELNVTRRLPGATTGVWVGKVKQRKKPPFTVFFLTSAAGSCASLPSFVCVSRPSALQCHAI